MGLLFVLVAFLTFMVLAYIRVPGWLWTIAAGLCVAGVVRYAHLVPATAIVIAAVFAVFALVLNVTALRRALISNRILAIYRRILPAMSQTEQEAIDAGTVWWDGDLFSGEPDWDKLLNYPRPRLSNVEQAFVDGPVEELCRMLSDWETTAVYQDLPPHVWQFIKDKGFLGMIIPKRYGGLEFSAYAHSCVVMKLATRSGAAAVSVMVPNSLGPAELLLHYGTDEQKNHYLPRLAKGLEIPCFALTNPNAGSDAAAIPDFGIVCRQDFQGEREVLGIRVTWEKRYITLGPIATLLGLAFRMHDPDRLLGAEFGGREDIGITCALIPTSHPGVNIGRRHFPLNAVFQNGPNSGKDVFIPMSWVIGGQAMAGQGWRMLMECLAAGRSISLPSSSCGMVKVAVRATGAYARVRSQFKTPIARFEGIEEALTRIGGNAYAIDAMRTMTAGAVDLGEKPSVVSAIVKYHATERGRQVINDAMDIEGGKGICLGPNNHLGRAYQQIPIAITVEGANILTRSLIIFGQGAIRGHPYVLPEIAAVREADTQKGSRDFDRAFFGHVSFVLTNAMRAFVMGLTGSHYVKVPETLETKRYYQQLTRFSAAFAFLSDVSMLVIGGALKRKEKISARLGDVLSQMYIASAVLKRYEDEGRNKDDMPLVNWAIWDCMFKAQLAFEGVLANYPNPFFAWACKWIIFPNGRPYTVPTDHLGHDVVRLFTEPSASRDRLTAGMYLPKDEHDPIGCLEAALVETLRAEPIEVKIRTAAKDGRISAYTAEGLLAAARDAGVITPEEFAAMERVSALRAEVIRVDDFPQDFGVSEIQQPTRHRAAA
jgi:acyl-CoA dehydrogenase